MLLIEVCGAHPQQCSETGCPALSGQAGVAGLLPGTLAAQTLWDVAPSRDTGCLRLEGTALLSNRVPPGAGLGRTARWCRGGFSEVWWRYEAVLMRQYCSKISAHGPSCTAAAAALPPTPADGDQGRFSRISGRLNGHGNSLT